MSDFRIREAHQNDVVGVAKVRVDTWQAAYKGDDFRSGIWLGRDTQIGNTAYRLTQTVVRCNKFDSYTIGGGN
jgi:hypothetical protein